MVRTRSQQMFSTSIIVVVTIAETAYIGGTSLLFRSIFLISQGILFAWHCIIYHQCIQQVVTEHPFVDKYVLGIQQGEAGLFSAFTELKVWEKNYSRNVMLLETFLASEKFQKNPSKTHIGSNNSHKMGKKIFLI